MSIIKREELNCHPNDVGNNNSDCFALRCDTCRWESGQYHYNAEANYESGELMSWSSSVTRVDAPCPVCEMRKSEQSEPVAMPSWERELWNEMN